MSSLNRPESQLTNPPGHFQRDKWTARSGPLSHENNQSPGAMQEGGSYDGALGRDSETALLGQWLQYLFDHSGGHKAARDHHHQRTRKLRPLSSELGTYQTVKALASRKKS